jgi:hypothetical protein
MQKIDLDPHDIGIWSRCIKLHKEPLERIIKREGWKNIPRVPVFELPKGYSHSYVLIDGHARHHAALKTKSLLPCNLYVPGEMIDIVKDGIADFRYAEESTESYFFHKIMLLYEIYEKSVRSKALQS